MKYPYIKYPADPIETHPDRKNILRPVIPIGVIYRGNKVRYSVLIDSGADYCIFHADIGELIEIDIKNAKRMEFFGVGGVRQEAFFHNIKIDVGGWEFPCYVGFSYGLKQMPYGIVGQDNFFSLFTVIFDKKKECLILKENKK